MTARCASSQGRPSSLIGIPYDRPVVGYGGKTINTLRLWAVKAPNDFDFAQFSSGDFVGALAETLTAETITRVLYPDDHTTQGKGLRFFQEYFLVACSLADLVRRFRAAGNDWSALPDKVAIQLNDTHPTLAVPELMRLLLDEAKLSWPDAWTLTQRTLAYTNHTLLPEALEKWPVQWFQDLLPRHLEIIYEINRRFLDDVRLRYPGDDGRIAARQPDRRRRVLGKCAWRIWPSSARTAPTAWPRCIRNCSSSGWCRISRPCFPNDSTTKPTASPRAAGCCWPTRRWRRSSPTPSAMAGSPTSRSWRN